MEKEMIRCPKCSHEQPGGDECDSCGVIFVKYYQAQLRLQEEAAQREAEKEKGQKRLGLFLQAAILVVLTAAVTYYFTRPVPPSSLSAKPQMELEQAAPLPAAPVAERSQASKPVGERPESSKSIAEKAQTEPMDARKEDLSGGSASGSIAKAREATVSIETPWGVGSGFFISKHQIVTSRHVLEVDPDQLAKFRRNLEENKKIVNSARQRLDGLRAHLGQFSHWQQRRQVEMAIEQEEQQLKKVMPQLGEMEQELKKMERKIDRFDVKVVLADGSSQNPVDFQLSERHDLAILSLFITDPPVLPRPPADFPLQQGDKLYAVGSPMGLRNTVTAGIFSGYQKRDTDGELFLQTDAPINPGNSGGPLIDEKGYVRGVNTMILRNAEGIGFAIPIEKVFDDFGFSIY